MTDLEARVAEAADALSLEGAKVSTEAVRKRIGGGSLRDISPALRKWRDQQGSVDTASVPIEIAEMGQRAIASIWKTAERLSSETVEGLRREHAERQAAAQGELNEAMQEIAALEASTTDLTAKNRDQAREIEHLRDRATRAETQAEASIGARADLQRTIDARDASLVELRASERSARDEAAELRGRVKALEERLDRESSKGPAGKKKDT